MVMLGMLVVLRQVIGGIILVIVSVVAVGALASSVGLVDIAGLALFRVEKKASISAMVHLILQQSVAR